MTWRFIVALMVATLGLAQAQAATRIDDPAKFVRSVYEKMIATQAHSSFAPPEDIYTPHLASLFALERREAGDGVGRMDFDFWSNAQDYTLTGLAVTTAPVEGTHDRQIVIAKFKNLGKPQNIRFYFEKTGAGWKLDDVRALGPEGWTLSLILKYGWDGKN